MEIPLHQIQIEISGVCNAKCPYCVTGQRNRRHEKTGGFMKAEVFRSCIERLLEKGLIHQKTEIALYNYGEPFLHPQFSEIISILEEFGQPYSLSTNASVLPDEQLFQKMSRLQTMQFSVCGCSQESYDRVHKLSYQTTRNNIVHMTELLHKYHPEAECILKLQMYRFNEHEYPEAIAFAKKNGMTVIPLHAIFANLQQQLSFINAYRKDKSVANSSEQLWYYLDELLDTEPLDSCPQWNSMVIDEELHIPVCCMVTKEMQQYHLSDLESFSVDTMQTRDSLSLCRQCICSGTAKSICLTPSYKKGLEYESILHQQRGKELLLLGVNGLSGSFRRMFPHLKCRTASLSEAFSFKKGSHFLIIADHRWWQYLPELQAKGAVENIDYLVYHLYLR